VERVLAAAILISVVAAVVAVLLFLLRRTRATVFRVFLALVAGFVTDFAIRAGFHLGSDVLWTSDTPPKAFVYVFDSLEWVYRDVCGLTTFIARLFAPGYIPGGDLILPEDERAYFVADLFRIIFWTFLFATGYFVLPRRTTQRSNEAVE
jgi:hypothetical protein